MILQDAAIKNAMKAGDVIISPFSEDQLNPNSYDVRLSGDFYIVRWELFNQRNSPAFYGPVLLEDGAPVHIPNGGTILGRTVEVIGSLNNVTAKVYSKSSTRRLGVSVCDDAGVGDIGYVNHYTVELTGNTNAASPMLVVGMPFAQMVFIRTEGNAEKPYNGQYKENEWPAGMVPKKYRNAIQPAPDWMISNLLFGW